MNNYPPESVLMVGFDGFIRFATAEITHLVGYTPAEVIGLPLNHFAAEHDRKAITKRWFEIREYCLNQPEHVTIYRLKTNVVHRDGRVFPIYLRLTPILEREEFMIIAENQAPQTITLDVGAVNSHDIQEILELILRQVSQFIDYEQAMLWAIQKQEFSQVVQGQTAVNLPHEKIMTLRPIQILQETHRPLLIRDCATDSQWEALDGNHAVGSWLGIPLVYRSELVGIMAFQSSKPDAFDEDDTNLSANFAEEAAIALHNAYINAEAHERAQRLNAINNVVTAVGRLNLDGVLEEVYRQVMQLMEVSSFYIGLYNPQNSELVLKQVYDNGKRIPDYSFSIHANEGVSSWVIQHKQSLIVGDFERDMLLSTRLYGEPSKSAIYVPLIVQDEVLGVLSVQSNSPDIFHEQDVMILETLAGPTAIAIRNAQLFDKMQRRLREVSALHELAKTITGSQDIQTIIQTAVDTTHEIFQCLGSAIMFYIGNSVHIEAEAGFPLQPRVWNANESIFEEIRQTLQPIYLAEITSPSIALPEAVKSLLLVPLMSQKQAIGILCIASDKPNSFTPDHERVLTIGAAQIAAAIENVRLLQEAKDRAHELEMAYRELKATDQLRQELVDNVSHELRAPLSFVRGYVSLMSAEELGAITPDQADALDVIDRKTDVMLRLINDMLEMEKIRPEKLQRQVLDITLVLQQVIEGASLAYADKGILFDLRISRDPVLVNVDVDRINQVLDNLISNAVKFSQVGKSITLECTVEHETARLAVIDEGPGIPAEALPRVFERFYQVPGTRQRGAGLGLAIVHQIVQAHGGKVGVTSEVGVGSTFFFYLPLERGNSSGV